MTRFPLTADEEQSVRRLLDEVPDPSPEQEAEIATKLIEHLSGVINETAQYWVKRLAGMARGAAKIERS